ncbi:SA1788 family PVL leukocidin-associated protein [uncultured Staphylococcus sp.]|uniref:SA1788 family PVL leukocidin-associated protein n=1 Tax=uncultured Staphylococcus sp. TaxID=189668 RepID=UPI0025DB8A04|nr:SA1788 family PVL leukocidin-associated protein [uncultured Staphylococcus sp.]
MRINLSKEKDKNGKWCYVLNEGIIQMLVPVDIFKDARRAGISTGQIKRYVKQGGISKLRNMIAWENDRERRERIQKEEQEHAEERRIKAERQEKLRRLSVKTRERNVKQAEMIVRYRVRDPYWFEVTYNQMFGKWGVE